MNIKKGEMKMEMESQEGKTERLRAEWGQEGGETREGGCHGGDFRFTGNGMAILIPRLIAEN